MIAHFLTSQRNKTDSFTASTIHGSQITKRQPQTSKTTRYLRRKSFSINEGNNVIPSRKDLDLVLELVDRVPLTDITHTLSLATLV